MNCKQTTPSTGTDKKAFKPWCGSCALKQEDRILGSFETLPAIENVLSCAFWKNSWTLCTRSTRRRPGSI